MTEQEWLASESLWAMLESIRGRVSDRQSRLYACACCRQVWYLLTDPRSRRAVEVAERFADGQATAEELETAALDAGEAWTAQTSEPAREAGAAASYAAAGADFKDAVWYAAGEAAAATLSLNVSHEAALLRDIVGNPFRPVARDPAWLTPTVTDLATAAYVDRAMPSGELDPARLAVLADALEDAGCTSDEMLGHLRGPGPHSRGCWAVDLILGKG